MFVRVYKLPGCLAVCCLALLCCSICCKRSQIEDGRCLIANNDGTAFDDLQSNHNSPLIIGMSHCLTLPWKHVISERGFIASRGNGIRMDIVQDILPNLLQNQARGRRILWMAAVTKCVDELIVISPFTSFMVIGAEGSSHLRNRSKPRAERKMLLFFTLLSVDHASHIATGLLVHSQ